MYDTKIVLIPAYKPEPALLTLLEWLSCREYLTILIDDGSGDAFHEIFRAAEKYAVVLSHTVNKGKGAALRTGMSYIQSHYPDAVIVTMDADGQHSITDAERILNQAQASPDQLVLGCRRLDRRVPLRSRFGNSITRLVFRLVSGTAVYDTQTGLRGFSSRLLPELLSVTGDRYEYEMNVLLHFAKMKIPMKELQIQTIYINENASSHFHPVRDSIRIYSDILKFSASSLIGFLVDYLVFCLLSVLLVQLPCRLTLSNIAARLISASVNFTLNRKFVFRSKGRLLRAALQYFALAAVILAGNTLLLKLLVDTVGINKYAAKLLTEVFFFVLSFTVQRCIIFKKGRN